MVLDVQQKQTLKDDLVSCLAEDQEIRRIVVFGSFVHSPSPEDMDVAIFQNSSESYLSLAVKYRKQTRPVSRRIPLDIVPLRDGVQDDLFLKEIRQGEVVFETSDV